MKREQREKIKTVTIIQASLCPLTANIPLVLLAILLFGASCVSMGPTQPTPADAPLWVTDTAAAYPDSEWYCVVASGRDKKSAENTAIASLARIFNVSIQETLSDKERSDSRTNRKRRVEVSSESQEFSRETSTNVSGLIGVQTDTWAAPDGKVYANARMNRRECSARYAAMIRENENLIEHLKTEAEKYPKTPDAVKLLNSAYDAAQVTDNFYRILMVLDPSATERRPQYGNAAMVKAIVQNAERSVAKEVTVNTETAGLNQAITKLVNDLFKQLEQLEEVKKGANVVGVYDFEIQPDIQQKEKSRGALSRYITATVNRLFTNARPRFITVERGKMEAVRVELNLHLSGDISDETAKSITGATGADIIVTGEVSIAPDGYRLSIFAVHLEKRERLADFAIIIPADDPEINFHFEQPESQKKPFRITAGPRAGVSPHFWTLSNDIKGDAESPAIGFEPAAQGAFYFTDLFALQTEIALSIDNVSYSGNEADGTAYTASFESLSLRVPLLARFTFRPGIFLLSTFGGVSFNFPLGDMKLYSSLYDDSSYRFLIPPGYVLGVNAGMKLGPGVLFVDARFSGDFAKTVIKDNSGTLALYTRNALSFSLGYEWEFTLKRQK